MSMRVRGHASLMPGIMKRGAIWMLVCLSILFVGVSFSVHALGYVIKRYELFESTTQLKNGSTVEIISNVLYAISFIIGLIILKKVRKHYLFIQSL
jgi:hypothetical protein